MKIPFDIVYLVLAFVGIGIIVVSCRVLNWTWLKPKKLEKLLRQQGLTGTPYQFLVGDLKTTVLMAKEAISLPMELTNHIPPRVMPFYYQTIRDYGKNCFIWNGPIPTLIIMNPEQIKEIFTKIYDFQKPKINPLVKPLVAGLGSYEDDKWAKHRKIINPAFHLEKLKNMLPEFHRSCSDMITKLVHLVPFEESREVDLWPFLVTFSADVISRSAFGSSYAEGSRIFLLLQQQNKLVLQAIQTVYIPGWRFLPTKLNKQLKKIDSEIQASLKGIITKRENEMKTGDTNAKDDLLAILLESNFRQIEENGNNKKLAMSIQDVIEECKQFYFAGQETTSVLLVWTIILLAKHQDWQSRAREEIERVFGTNKPDFEGLNRLKVVTMILYEVLRLYPPVIMYNRDVKKNMRLGSLTVPAGVQVSVPVLLLHHDTELWGDDAAEFKPERFADGISKATKNQLCYLPFGWGPRVCIGQNFALAEAKLALAMILGRFSVEPSPSYTHAPFTVLTLQPQFGAHVILRRLQG